ncbi:hypothetical protein IW262DRAFT_662615 [Armillaria fumosa]|nr:hypothetical protein IW262DRAFT_662615 [Armillaria fumosa]
MVFPYHWRNQCRRFSQYRPSISPLWDRHSTVIYYKRYPDDPWLFRYSVAILWILDTLHVAISTHALYFYMIESFRNYLPLFGIIWSFRLQLLLNVPYTPLEYGNLVINLIWSCHGLFFFDISTISTSIYTVFSTFAGADFFIAVIMCYYLHKGKSMTGFSGTIKIIIGLMRLVVISGLATSACSLSTLVAYIAWPSTLIYLAVGGILPKRSILTLC